MQHVSYFLIGPCELLFLCLCTISAWVEYIDVYDSYSLSLFLFVSHSRGCECSKSTLLVVPLGGPYYVGGCDLCWALPLPIVSSATAILVIVWGVCLGSNPDYTGDDLCL